MHINVLRCLKLLVVQAIFCGLCAQATFAGFSMTAIDAGAYTKQTKSATENPSRSLNTVCGSSAFANCRSFISYSSSRVNLLNGANFTYTSGTSKIKVNPVAVSPYIPDNPKYYLPILVFANAKASANSPNGVKADLLDNEGGLFNIKFEYDYLPHGLIANKREIDEGLKKNLKLPVFGMYFELFGGGKYIQGSGVSSQNPSITKSPGNFLQWQAGGGIDVSLPLATNIDPTRPETITKQGTMNLRGVYVYNHVMTDNMELIFPGSKRSFGYGQLSADFYVSNVMYFTVGASGLNTNDDTMGNNVFFSFNLLRP